MDLPELSPQQRAFVDAYTKNASATDAYLLAYGGENMTHASAISAGQKVLKGKKVQAWLAAHKTRALDHLAVTPQMVAARYWELAVADPNDLAQHRRCACRYCWGDGHRYQWTENELFRAIDAAAAKNKPPPDFTGGIGFKKHAAPNPDCPECDGGGIDQVFLADSRNLKGGARALYKGVKKTKEGVEVMFHDQMRALENFCKITGLDVKRMELTGAQGAPLIPPAEMTDEQLAAVIAAAAPK